MNPDPGIRERWGKPEVDLRLRPPIHYYGDIVRVLFLIAGGALIVAPVLAPLSSGMVTLLAPCILLLGVMAGITNPRQRWTMLANLLIAAIALLVLEGVAIGAYRAADGISVPFLLWQALALNFFIALYFAAKTLRGQIVS